MRILNFDFFVSIYFYRDFRLINLKLISFFVARNLTVSLGGPVVAHYGEADRPSFGLGNVFGKKKVTLVG